MNVSSAQTLAAMFPPRPAVAPARPSPEHAISASTISSHAAPASATARDSIAHAGVSSPGVVSDSSVVTAGKAAAHTAEETRQPGTPQDSAESRRAAREEKLIQAEIKVLAARDREVRAHEQAHMAAGGQYAGAAKYEYERGPNGVNYAVGGEVPISTSEEPTPEATLRKAQIIRRAALAPADPSPQDRRVAAMATQMESAARVEMARAREVKAEKADAAPADVEKKQASGSAEAAVAPEAESAAGALSQQETNAASERMVRRLTTYSGTESRAPGTLLSLRA